ncbi:hypothetical protein RDWZM_010281 [Blomia tropicalis]|uniref:Kynurenine 3-monooxygenase n=1 Tax=Blomia tropicalis TaxID=40697 RepID=A0A9Q0RIL2_BLOTA|nr:hypothetical protein BLOT_010485 [Blomia tropicalis]KAJ6215781.1 hypothetical protein RDWZM_010281 [Blomia tropicalis]
MDTTIEGNDRQSSRFNHQRSSQQHSGANVAIVGGGLVGSMASCFLARRGYKVDVYEMRDDPRQMEHVVGKSINLALSERGRRALRTLGLEDRILDQYSTKMYARMIHDQSGSIRTIPYGRPDQYILSIGRRFLNELLINEAEKSDNVQCHFGHKLINSGHIQDGELHFQTNEIDEHKMVQADIIIGCDGAHSAVRRAMTKLLLLDYSQKYIEHGYIELSIQPTDDGQYAMEPNYLHIWPRGTFMMIALPNLDRSFTVTLFMPFDRYKEITDRRMLLQFFEKHFPDSIPLLTKDGLCKAFFSGSPSPLISIKCSPYNYKDRILLMGDAAHAMVPFYGQGMNCGFEDCLVLDELLQRYGDDRLGSILKHYTTERVDNCHSINDLAMYNYVEMRDLVNRRSFLWRKRFDNWMHTLFPSLWIPLYTMVTFTRTPYGKCIRDKSWQDDMIDRFLKLILFGFGLGCLILLSTMLDTNPTLNPSTMFTK